MAGGAGGGGKANNYFGGGGGGAGLFGGGGGGASVISHDASGGGGASFIADTATDPRGPTLSAAPPGVMITYEAATASLSSDALTFGAQPVGSAGPEEMLAVINGGDAPLTVLGVQTGGTRPGDYLVSDLCQQPVAPGGSCQIGVRFAPQQLGASSATLTLLADAGSAPAPVSLSGTGGAGSPGTTTAAGAGSPGTTTTAGTGSQVSATPPAPATGSRGTALPAADIVCGRARRGRRQCTLEFAPGATGRARLIRTSFVIERSRRPIRAGALSARAGRITHKAIGTLARPLHAGHQHRPWPWPRAQGAARRRLPADLSDEPERREPAGGAWPVQTPISESFTIPQRPLGRCASGLSTADASAARGCSARRCSTAHSSLRQVVLDDVEHPLDVDPEVLVGGEVAQVMFCNGISATAFRVIWAAPRRRRRPGCSP